LTQALLGGAMMVPENNNQKNDIRIDIYDIVRDLAKDFWLLIIIGLSAAMCTYMIADRFYKPTYKTSATFVVTTKGSNYVYTNLAAANMVAETLTKVFSSTVLNNQVTSDIGMDYVPGTVEAE
jgi:capsular polysaccharide biosynthesis protein